MLVTNATGTTGEVKAVGEVGGPLELPCGWKGRFPIPAVPRIELMGVEWQEPGLLLSIKGQATLLVTNTNQFDIDLRKLA